MTVGDLQRGVALLNARHFFEAHEALEDVWRACAPESKRAYQGLVQVAVAMHHVSTGNLAGGRSVLVKSLANLDGADEMLKGIDTAALRAQLLAWQFALESGGAFPAWPVVTGAVLESRVQSEENP